MDAVLGISVGPSSARLRLALLESNDEIITSSVGIVSESYATSCDALLREVLRLLGDYPELHLAGVGICVTGELDGSGRIIRSRAVPRWKQYNPRIDIQIVLQVPVLAVGSGSGAARGELTHIKRQAPFTYVLWGSGFSVTSVEIGKKGRPLVIPTGLGHMAIPSAFPLRCSCGKKGHLEGQIAGANLRTRFGQRVDQLETRHWSLLLDDVALGLYSIGLGRLGVPIVLADKFELGSDTRFKHLQTKIRDLAPNSDVTPKVLPAIETDPKLVGAVALAREAASSR